MSGPHPYVSVFIPTYNGGPLFDRVLTAVFAQKVDFEFEVLCIDSGSKDETLDIIKKHERVRLIQIPNSEFNHGLTRNRGAKETTGEILILLVQDAVPHGTDWMRTFVSNFEDPEVAGVYCHQLPHAWCGPFIRDRLKGWVSGEGEVITKKLASPMDFWLMPPLERWRTIAFDDVSSAIRRKVLTKLPFQKRQFGEDITWAKSAVLAGHKVLMDPRCAVEHSHTNSIWYEFRRSYLDHQNIHNLTGLQLASNIHRVLEYTGNAARHLWNVLWQDRETSIATKLWWSAKIPYFTLSQNFAQYLGPLSDKKKKRGLWGTFDRLVRQNI